MKATARYAAPTMSAIWSTGYLPPRYRIRTLGCALESFGSAPTSLLAKATKLPCELREGDVLGPLKAPFGPGRDSLETLPAPPLRAGAFQRKTSRIDPFG